MGQFSINEYTWIRNHKTKTGEFALQCSQGKNEKVKNEKLKMKNQQKLKSLKNYDTCAKLSLGTRGQLHRISTKSLDLRVFSKKNSHLCNH